MSDKASDDFAAATEDDRHMITKRQDVKVKFLYRDVVLFETTMSKEKMDELKAWLDKGCA